MSRYYISNPNAEKGFEELTETEFFAIVGDDTHRPYAAKVYRGEMLLADVPEEYRSKVESIVANKVARWGEYGNQDIPAHEFQNMLKGVL